MQAIRPSSFGLARLVLDVAILLLVGVVLLAVVLGRVVPLGGGQTLIISGPSMEPTLPLGSAIVIEPIAPADIEAGDVVSVRSGSERAIYTHRVLRTLSLEGEPYLETKGDNNPVADGATVPAASVIGRVTVVLPVMGFVVAWLSVPAGVAFVIGLGALLVLTALLVDTIEDDRRRARRTMARLAPVSPAFAFASAGAASASVPSFKRTVEPRAFDASVASLVDRRPTRPELGISPSEPRRRRTTRPRTSGRGRA